MSQIGNIPPQGQEPTIKALPKDEKSLEEVKLTRWQKFKRLFGFRSKIEKVFEKIIKQVPKDQKDKYRAEISLMREYLRTLRGTKGAEKTLNKVASDVAAAMKRGENTAGLFAGKLLGLVHEIKKVGDTHIPQQTLKVIQKAFDSAKVAQTNLISHEDISKKIDEFRPGGGLPVATEVVERTKTVELLEARYSTALEQVKKQLGDDPENKELQAKQAYFTEKLEKLKNFQSDYQGKTWITSEDFRAMAERHGLKLGEMHSIAGLVNARTHKIETGDTSATYHRSGAFMDTEDGQKVEILKKRLECIQCYKKWQQYGQGVEVEPSKLKELREKYEEKWKEIPGNENEQPVDYDLERLKVDETIIKEEIEIRKNGLSLEDFQKRIKDVETKSTDLAAKMVTQPDSEENSKQLIAFSTLKTELEKELRNRKQVLEDQFLQLVQTQVPQFAQTRVQQRLAGKPISGSFLLTQMSLLDPATRKKFPGFIQNEENFMRDMQYIFDQFNNKNIVLRATTDNAKKDGPYVDAKGNICLAIPKDQFEKLSDKDKETKLETLFFNVSVQGQTQNKGKQKEINDKAFQTLTTMDTNKRFTSNISALKNRLDKEGGSYDMGMDILNLTKEIAKDTGKTVGTGVNCFSGKDRTGELLKRLAVDTFRTDQLRIAGKDVTGKQRPLTSSQEARIDEYTEFVAREHGIARHIAKENIGDHVLKIWDQKGLSFVEKIANLWRQRALKA